VDDVVAGAELRAPQVPATVFDVVDARGTRLGARDLEPRLVEVEPDDAPFARGARARA
jgi:hypothetical protein